MKKLYLGNGDKQFKFADTTTEIHLNALDNGSAAALTTAAKVRIKNDSGYLLEVSANIDKNHAVITSGQLSKLPAGSYLIELWDTVDGGTAIYPSDGFLSLQINDNVTGISGGLVSSITVDDFIQQFSDLSQNLKQEVSDAVTNGVKGDKGDPGDGSPQFIDNLTALQAKYPTGTKGLFVTLDTGLRYVYVEGAWKDFGVYQSVGIADGTVTPEKTTFASESGYKNEIDSSKIIQGRYYSGNSVGGYTLGDATYGTIEIDLIPGESYLLFGASGSLSWIYNSASLTKLSSFTGQSSYLNTASGLSNDYVIKFKAPLGATTIYISARIGLATMLPTMLFRTGDSLFLKDYVPYNTYLNRKLTIKDLQEPLAEKALSLIPKNKIHVKKDGTGDFTSLVTAIRSISDSSIDNVYDIYVYDDHDIMDELGGQTFAESLTSSSDREGLVVPEYVNIIAIGKKELSLKLNHSWNVNYNAIKALSVL
ncbi:tail fiber protein [Lactobacillus phage Bassarid]|nr:tail fiber protein [Lactobacillus phage Bassarid]